VTCDRFVFVKFIFSSRRPLPPPLSVASLHIWNGCAGAHPRLTRLFRSLRKCPQCGKNALKRLIGTGAGIIFKGSGFYQTDYRSDSYTQRAKSEKSKTETKPETKSETKTESKSETKSAPAETKSEKKEKKK
jgi:hypothetical protein